MGSIYALQYNALTITNNSSGTIFVETYEYSSIYYYGQTTAQSVPPNSSKTIPVLAFGYIKIYSNTNYIRTSGSGFMTTGFAPYNSGIWYYGLFAVILSSSSFMTVENS